MSTQASLDFAHARRNDPETSKAAARSVSLVNLGRTKERILSILKIHGPLTDEGIAQKWNLMVGAFVVSPSGLRSRRAWLVDQRLVEACGIGKTASGRDCQIWMAK